MDTDSEKDVKAIVVMCNLNAMISVAARTKIRAGLEHAPYHLTFNDDKRTTIYL